MRGLNVLWSLLAVLRYFGTRWLFFLSRLAATGRDSPLVAFVSLMRLLVLLELLNLLNLLRLLGLLTIVDCFILLLGRLFLFIHFLLNLKIFFLCPAALPAVLPVADQEVEAECINLHARLEANAKVAVVHFVLVDIGVQEV